jgi:hypothetical protein
VWEGVSPSRSSLGVWGSAVSSFNGVRGEAPAALRFFAIFELILSHGERKDAICTSYMYGIEAKVYSKLTKI